MVYELLKPNPRLNMIQDVAVGQGQRCAWTNHGQPTCLRSRGLDKARFRFVTITITGQATCVMVEADDR